MGFHPCDLIDVLDPSSGPGGFEEPVVDVFPRFPNFALFGPALHDVVTVGVDVGEGRDEDSGSQEPRKLGGLGGLRQAGGTTP